MRKALKEEFEVNLWSPSTNKHACTHTQVIIKIKQLKQIMKFGISWNL